MPRAKQTPFISRATWGILVAGILSLLLLVVIDSVALRLHAETSDGRRIATEFTLGIGLLLSVLAPWFSPRPVLERFVLSLAAGGCWVICMGVFLSYYNEWYSRRVHSEEIELAFKERLLPATAFVRNFVSREHRLPTDEELVRAGWQIGTIGGGRDAYVHFYRERPSWFDGWGVLGKDFLVETAVPGWNLYYRSWDNQRVEKNWE